ncbi:indole-3-glycerol phosphate synthase TrpC [Paenibacillus endoradicis]|uniref:indole-3-glycerol phosphate synthase TrpC n=1 Tax=Paenibacillus endoradicis TaxID=2972487 RepID=UPI00215928E1|nr:indole-3-glycerol phosphate synthase TrpC [Paenibacillus endoradicis]MCR8660290.1 indole-3-glycerol phosphate synthase TrpC [Paenibacillus endoradicis]
MFLNKIVDTKKVEVQQLAEKFNIKEYEQHIATLPPCRGFEKALRAGGRNRDLALIAEVKKASPSKGLIREDFHPVELALAYEAAGADCLSVLTDVDYFQGSNDYLKSISEAVKLPLLRKDFIIDYRQIYEARAIGADCILLIVAILSDEQLGEFHDLAKKLGMDVLVEVHDASELERVLKLNKATLIGVNNRNLHTFETKLETTEQLIGMMPEHVLNISESGILSQEDYEYVRSVGAQGLLIGEHFMRQGDVGQAIEQLMGQVTKV